MKKIAFFLLVFLISFTQTIQAQFPQRISQEDAFMYYMKVYGYKPKDKAIHQNWFSVYLSTFKSREFNEAINDEFKKKAFDQRESRAMNSKLANMDFTKQFTMDGFAHVGQYNFDNSKFPLNFNVQDNFDKLVHNAQGLSIKVESIINKMDLKNGLLIPSSKASSFISNRKSSDGVIDRKVFIKLFYNVTRKPSSSVGINGYNKRFIKIYVSKIEVYADESMSDQMGTITSKRDWVDKVNGVMSNNGKNIYYFDRWWKETETETGSQYYAVVNLKDGRHENPVKIYYSRSKQIRSIANYTSVGTGKWRKADGLMKDYYYSVKLMQTVEYKSNKWHGTLRKWNKEKGYLEEVTEYRNGKKNGCEQKYNPDGSCRIQWGNSVWFYYENDETVLSNTSCKCDEQGKQKSLQQDTFDREHKVKLPSSSWQKEKLVKLAKFFMKKAGNKDYEIVNFYCVDNSTQPVVNADGSIAYFYLYAGKRGKVHVYKFYKNEIKEVDSYDGALKKQIPAKL